MTTAILRHTMVAWLARCASASDHTLHTRGISMQKRLANAGQMEESCVSTVLQRAAVQQDTSPL